MLSMAITLALLFTLLILGLTPGALWTHPNRLRVAKSPPAVKISHRGTMELPDSDCAAA
ncbi:MAG: hypothetical protein GY708_17185 [Actinomycetia bacterium]|nr:hypothetical protein [Actinomycetes bacterium]